MIDIDDLDFINKQLGTATGDKVIQMIAQTLTRTMRTTDMIGRHGSDEFAIILPNTNLDNAKIAVRRIQDAIGMIDATQAGVKVTISGGLSQHHGELAETLIIITEARLHQAKNQGKNQFVME
jgi:diguanylate cyclase (GGDEF)-like protein